MSHRSCWVSASTSAVGRSVGAAHATAVVVAKKSASHAFICKLRNKTAFKIRIRSIILLTCH